MVYLFTTTPAQRESITTSLSKFAKSYHSSLTIVLVNPFDFPGLPSKLGLEKDPVYPAGAVHQLSNDRIYPYPKGMPLTPSALQKWGLDVYQGRLKHWMPEGGATTGVDDSGGKGRIQMGRATAHVSIAKGWPGVKIKVAGRDEL
jgi:protein disulfide-isomerase A1